jgi:hypothetical protein
MRRWSFILGPLAVVLAAPAARADAFDYYTNPVLYKVPEAKGVKELKRLTLELMADHDHVLPDVTAALVVVQTNEGRYGKLLVQPARRKLGTKVVPIVLIDRFVTFREGDERAVQAAGKNLNLFNGFHLNLDIGQVVPPELGGDLRFVAQGGEQYLEPLGKAKLYLLTQPLPEAKPKKGEKLVLGPSFETRYYNGTYKLYDDGRRSGTLKLTVADDGTVKGDYYSDADGRKYEVAGKLGTPRHSIEFTIKYPRTEEQFQGWLFTGDAKALAGTARMQSREAGFYAVRVEE